MTGRFQRMTVAGGAAYLLAAMHVAVLFLFASAVSADEPDPAKIVREVKKVLDGLDTCSFDFKTVQEWKGSDFERTLEGTIYMRLKKPFKLRVEREDNLIVIDGETVWTWLPRHNQVQVSDYDREGPEFPSPHTVFERYSKERQAAWRMEDVVNGSICDVLSLITKDPTDVLITVWIDRKLHFPVKAVEETVTGDRITHTLANVTLDVKLGEELFTFEPPEGAVVVDMRE